jgi:hypothetical protein
MARSNAGNWVDRGEPLEKVLGRVLSHALDLEPPDARLEDYVNTVRGMVEADGSEADVSTYVRNIRLELDLPVLDPDSRRTLAIALWHIAKAGLIRDRAERRASELMSQLPPEGPLADRLADAILRAPVTEPTRKPMKKPRPNDVDVRKRGRSDGNPG